MAAPITKLQQVKLPTGPAPLTPEQQYWKGFKSSQNIPSQSPITHISFPPPPSNPLLPSTNDYFAVTTGTRVQIFSIRTRKLIKTITRFSDIAHSAEIRRDGRVMVAGDETGKIQVFDVNSRAILKTWEEHKQPVWTTKFSPTELTTVMSASDDRTVRLWDLPTQESTTTFVGHEDYVRSGSFMPGTMSNLIVSGSYDGTVRLWDPRVPSKAAMVFKHAAPVETVLPMPSGTTVLAAADNQISVLDLVAGKPLHLIKNHQKTVTSLCLASNGTRLVSGGLDGHVKVFETAGWNVVAGSKYPAPVLAVNVVSAGANREDKHLVVGMQSGVLSIRTRLSGQQKVKEREREKEMQALIAGTLDDYDKKNKNKKRTRGIEKKLRGLDFVGEGVDVIIEGNDRKERKPESFWERDLRQGKYAQALDTVLNRGLPAVTVLTLLTALRHRSAMRVAFQGRDENTVQPILKWVVKHITDPRYVGICVDSALLLLDIYSEHVGGSPELEHNFKILHRRVRTEVERSQQACQTSGMLEMLMTGMP
ncbi:U3 small nucleolar RNA-associated protein [Lachnellula hyalina]|uniref:U3 small nucleolar RNA-associated protein n=1 Tax=Lachnellula hyalina TaxID=1316788 RepID=A0A8H8R6I3_9HELO|nr:U3 small nucleolar RNA-associated protein [Lachnellula hyalina]TVY28425.1 U3 small nucleolar RNA-associated protein [Lachnellula hyalina]